MAVNYDKDTDYQALINEAVAAGDYAAAAQAEQQRNAKINYLNQTGTNKWNATTSTNYAKYLDPTYTATGNYNDAGLSAQDQSQIAALQNQYYEAKSLGDTAAMNAAHAAAEAIRAGYGYSGGGDGSDYISLVQQNSSGKPTFDYDYYNDSKPTYESQYSARIDEMLNQILNRDAFSYNAEEDTLYQQYKDQYQREGQKAMKDTLGQASARTGGLASSYAQSVAQQANQAYAQQLADKIPELYQLAYEMYLDDIDLKVQDYGLLTDMDDTQYSRYRDTMSDWRDDRDFAYGAYRDDVGDYQWQTEFAYNANRDTIADSRYDTEWAYQVAQDKLAQSNWETEFNYGKEQDALAQENWETEFNYGKTQDALAQENWEKEFEYGKTQDSLAQSNWEKEFNTANSQWQQEFNAANSQWQKEYELAAAKQAASGTGSGSGSGNGYTGGSGSSDSDGGTSYNNGGLTTAQVKALQKALGVTADGYYGPASKKAAGGLTAAAAYKKYVGTSGFTGNTSTKDDDSSASDDQAAVVTAANSLGLGPVSATMIQKLLNAGAVRESNGKFVWNSGWSASNYKTKMSSGLGALTGFYNSTLF